MQLKVDIFSFQLADIISYPTILSILGNVGLILAFTFIGPLPHIPINTSFTLVTVCAALIGYSETFVMISTLIRAQRAAIEEGYSKDTETYHLISGEISN